MYLTLFPSVGQTPLQCHPVIYYSPVKNSWNLQSLLAIFFFFFLVFVLCLERRRSQYNDKRNEKFREHFFKMKYVVCLIILSRNYFYVEAPLHALHSFSTRKSLMKGHSLEGFSNRASCLDSVTALHHLAVLNSLLYLPFPFPLHLFFSSLNFYFFCFHTSLISFSFFSPSLLFYLFDLFFLVFFYLFHFFLLQIHHQ